VGDGDLTATDLVAQASAHVLARESVVVRGSA
jgi:hypothetical protein